MTPSNDEKSAPLSLGDVERPRERPAAAPGDAVSQRDTASLFKETPYWWDQVHPPQIPAEALPKEVDVAIVGSGYTGLCAALQTARGGRSTIVFDAEAAGWGCSTRNGGQISTSIKPPLQVLARRYGGERGRAILEEGKTALEWIESFAGEEGLDCDFRRCGRFHAAHTPQAYEQLARKVEVQKNESGIEAYAVPRAEQHKELGSDAYFGGVVYLRHASLHPAKYHKGLLQAVLAAGASIQADCPVLHVAKSGGRFLVETQEGILYARDVLIATNGYSGKLSPWLRRRVIPIGSSIIASEPLPAETIERLFPTGRVASDTCRIIYYYRPSPDRSRVLFGGRVSARECGAEVSAPRLHRDMARIFPELSGVGLSHCWSGTVAYSFDEIAHCGRHDGIHYALGYCGSGVSLASYLGMRMGQKILGLGEGRTAFDDLPFPTRPFYSGTPWFLPAVVAWYRWRDRREWKDALEVHR